MRPDSTFLKSVGAPMVGRRVRRLDVKLILLRDDDAMERPSASHVE